MAVTYQVKKKAIGGYSVSYECPHCATALTSTLNEAGTSQPCPTCTKPFVVPGKAEFDQLKAKQEAERREKELLLQQEQKVKALHEQGRAFQKQRAEDEARKQRAKVAEENDAHRKYHETHCPFCFEEIKRGVKKCKHCHEYLDKELRERATKQEIARIRVPLEDVLILIVEFWVASIVIGLICWAIFGAIVAGNSH